jgi:hypothetical protein
MRVTVLMLALVGCTTGAPVSTSAPPAVSPSQVSSASSSQSVGAVSSGIAATLPTELGGLPMSPPQPLRAEFLAPLAAQLGVDPSSIEGAVVTPVGHSGGADVAVVRVPGVATDKLVDAFMAFNAKANEIPAGAKPGRERIGGKDVVVVRTPGPEGTTFILVVYGRGDTAYMVASNNAAVVEEAMSKLP